MVRWCMKSFMCASDFLRFISCQDIYSRRCTVDHFPSPSREHIVPKRWLPTKEAIVNPYNIFICTSLVNSRRGSLRFADENQLNNNATKHIKMDGYTGIVVDRDDDENTCIIIPKTAFIPPPHARGPIARTCMYMLDQYPIIPGNIISTSLMHQWHEEHPVTDWEMERQRRIIHYFPTVSKNPYVR